LPTKSWRRGGRFFLVKKKEQRDNYISAHEESSTYTKLTQPPRDRVILQDLRSTFIIYSRDATYLRNRLGRANSFLQVGNPPLLSSFFRS
jgi:hypothetical protein